jgi:hypothetical protein
MLMEIQKILNGTHVPFSQKGIVTPIDSQYAKISIVEIESRSNGSPVPKKTSEQCLIHVLHVFQKKSKSTIVIFRFRSPTRPNDRATSKPARVLSAKLAIT